MGTITTTTKKVILMLLLHKPTETENWWPMDIKKEKVKAQCVIPVKLIQKGR